MKRILLMVAAVMIVAVPTWAFHDGGVAHCNGCHTMHNSQGTQPMNGTDVDADGNPINGSAVGTGYPNLLLFANKSDVCLRCHYGDPGSYHVWSNAGPTAPGGMKSAGNYVFLEETNINDGHGGATEPIPGYAAGHTILSGIVGNDPEGVNTYAPGADTVVFPTDELGCSSCHDPHGTNSFRLLYQDGQTIGYNGGADSLLWSATIDATGISVFGSETQSNYNLYRSGYSEWCSTCHEKFHAKWGTEFIHPSGQALDTDEIASYNRYRGTTDCIANPPGGGVPCGSFSGGLADAYFYLVPIEDPGFTELAGTVGGAGALSKVVCVSCHRAHATSGPDAGRWDFNVTFLHEDGAESGSYALPHDDTVGTIADDNQRSLCNKCHSKDEFDTDEFGLVP